MSVDIEVLRHMLPRTQALGRLIERYLREGPFVCASDDPDALLFEAAGKRIVSIDQSHLFIEDPSAPPTKYPDCGTGVRECGEHEADRAPSGCFHCDECGWMREPW